MSIEVETRRRKRVRAVLLFGSVFVLGIVLGAFLLRGGGQEPMTTDPAAAGHSHEAATWWTCSMHPQIRLPEPGKCPICFMDLIPLEPSTGDESPTQLSMSDAAAKLAEIATTPVTRGTPEAEIRLLGRVAVDERQLKRITSWVGGRLERLFVDFTGVAVRQGEPLVEIYSPELYSAQVELVQALRAMEELRSSRVDFIRDSAERTVESSREKLRLLGLGQAQIDELERDKTPRERMTIHAPIGGIVVHKNAVEGSYVDTGTPIYTIADLSQVWVMLDAYESDLSRIGIDQPVVFETEAYPGETFAGRVAFIDPLVDPATRTVTVRVNAPNPGGRLKPDMFVRAEIRSIESAGKPLMIPASAPLRTGRRAIVYVRVPDTERPTFEGREVVLGPRAGDFYQVESGLEEGEQVVTHGAFKIDSEMQIQAKPSMMSPVEHDSQRSTEETLASPPASFRDELKRLYDPYLDLQRALAADDPDRARAEAARIDAAVAGIGSGLMAKARLAWQDLAAQIRGAARSAGGAVDIEGIRSDFETISNAIIILERAVGPPNGETHRLAFCPMAFENRGALWVQTEKEIENPYFGDLMLRCGEFREAFEQRR